MRLQLDIPLRFSMSTFLTSAPKSTREPGAGVKGTTVAIEYVRDQKKIVDDVVLVERGVEDSRDVICD